MAEILLCPLKKALTDFCKGNIDNQVVEKIEFKEEIIYIMNNYAQNPNILKPRVKSNITKRLFTSDGIIEKETQKQVNLFEEVIKYAENDVDVLPILYQCMDELSKKALSTNITSFITAGSLAWHGLLSNLPNECLEQGKYDKNRHRMTKINSKLFRLEMKELEFVKKAIKGGRVCPRIHKINGKIPISLDLVDLFPKFKSQNDKYVYLDISGMYASIMKNEIFPFGKSQFSDQAEMNEIMSMCLQFERQHQQQKLNWRAMYEKLTRTFGCFIVECEFEENKNNLEPVVQYKKDGKTYYTVEKRTDTITSVDIALIIASGGQIHNITRVLKWEQSGQIMKKWMEKSLELKEQGQRDDNQGLKTFGKLCSNASYGQSLKGDKNEVIRFINCFEDADKFVTENIPVNFFDMDEYDVYVGKKQVNNETFVTSRCQQIGAFVLAYTRAMIFEICEIAMPNRYNELGVKEQPVYGDTDSLVFREWQAHLLIKAGWVKFENGKLTDELGEKSHWFCPPQYKQPLENLNWFSYLPLNKSLTFEEYQEMIWKEATEDEKRDPSNFKFYFVTEGIFAAPKSYACRYTNNDGTKVSEKLKFKGIPTSALIGDQTLNYELIKEAYTNKEEQYMAVLQSKPQVIKNFSKRETKRAFLEVVDSNLRRDKFAQRQLFKTEWAGRFHIDENYTVPYGWGGVAPTL